MDITRDVSGGSGSAHGTDNRNEDARSRRPPQLFGLYPTLPLAEFLWGYLGLASSRPVQTYDSTASAERRDRIDATAYEGAAHAAHFKAALAIADAAHTHTGSDTDSVSLSNVPGSSSSGVSTTSSRLTVASAAELARRRRARITAAEQAGPKATGHQRGTTGTTDVDVPSTVDVLESRLGWALKQRIALEAVGKAAATMRPSDNPMPNTDAAADRTDASHSTPPGAHGAPVLVAVLLRRDPRYADGPIQPIILDYSAAAKPCTCSDDPTISEPRRAKMARHYWFKVLTQPFNKCEMTVLPPVTCSHGLSGDGSQATSHMPAAPTAALDTKGNKDL